MDECETACVPDKKETPSAIVTFHSELDRFRSHLRNFNKDFSELSDKMIFPAEASSDKDCCEARPARTKIDQLLFIVEDCFELMESNRNIMNGLSNLLA